MKKTKINLKSFNFQPIPGHERYLVNSMGTCVYDSWRDYFKTPSFQKRKGPCYGVFCLHVGKGKFKTFFAHRLVAETFIPLNATYRLLKENGVKLQVHHRDHNTHNNDVSNLEWCTQSENLKYNTEWKKRNNKEEK